MSNELTLREQATAIARSGLFGLRDETQVLALMAVAQAQGRHPASVAQEYSIISGRPALKADAMLARFQAAGGAVRWICLTDERAEAEFRHPQGGALVLDWSIQRAERAGLTRRDGPWKQYPRAMLRARLISEGIRSVFPGVVQGEYAEAEVADMPPRDVEPTPIFPEQSQPTLLEDAERQIKAYAASHGRDAALAVRGPKPLAECSDDELRAIQRRIDEIVLPLVAAQLTAPGGAEKAKQIIEETNA